MNIPEELIGEILSLLTVKSLMRMKCVNKSWNTLISDPIFVKLHLMRSPRNTHFILYSSIYSSRSANILPISVSHLLKSRNNTVMLTDYPYRRFHSKDLSRIIGSCNGLICLLGCICNQTLDYRDYEYSLYFWNPATRTKSEKLGYICPTFVQVQFAFGYDNSTDTYKVVMLNLERNTVRTTVKVFTLGENVWRDIDCFRVLLVDRFPNYLDSHDGVYFRNSIDWLVHHEYNCHLKNLTIKEYVIVSLDLGTETYSQLLLPPCCNEYLLDTTTSSTGAVLFVSLDCLCFSYDFEKTYFVIWKMKEFGVEESWTQFLKISYLDLNISIMALEDYNMRLIPLCFSDDDDALIFANNFGDKPFLYDWRNNRVKRIESIKSVQWYDVKEYNVESLVSTC